MVDVFILSFRSFRSFIGLRLAILPLYRIKQKLPAPNISKRNLPTNLPNLPTTTTNNINPHHLIHLINHLIINSFRTFINDKFEQFVGLGYVLLGAFVVGVQLYYGEHWWQQLFWDGEVGEEVD